MFEIEHHWMKPDDRHTIGPDKGNPGSSPLAAYLCRRKERRYWHYLPETFSPSEIDELCRQIRFAFSQPGPRRNVVIATCRSKQTDECKVIAFAVGGTRKELRDYEFAKLNMERELRRVLDMNQEWVVSPWYLSENSFWDPTRAMEELKKELIERYCPGSLSETAQPS